MDKIYDFSDCFVFPINDYTGRDRKEKIIFDGDTYLMKFRNSPKRQTSLNSPQTNNIFSEYIGCHIIDTMGFSVQETLLGTYRGEMVVVCKDFTYPGVYSAEFADLSNSFISNSKLKPHPELNSVLSCYEERFGADASHPLRQHFWDLFIIDSFLGNFDRHAGNWGFLVNDKTGSVDVSPIYDCGSCLFPALGEHALIEVLSDIRQIDARVYEYPLSSILDCGEKIRYFEFISSLQNEECNAALLRVYPQICLNKIFHVIDNTPIISDIRKKFYKTMLTHRYEKILHHSYEKLISLNLDMQEKNSGSLKDSLCCQIESASSRAAESQSSSSIKKKEAEPEI